jgi:hypothetical protein
VALPLLLRVRVSTVELGLNTFSVLSLLIIKLRV